MAPLGKIYSYPNNFRVARAQALAALNGLEIEVAQDFQMGVTNRSPEFLSKFPLGKVPAFESADGSFFLTEGQAIARYVAESGPNAGQLVGEDAQTRALIEQWSCFAEQEVASQATPPLLMTLYKIIPFDEAHYGQCVAAVERAAKAVEAHLADGKQYLVADRLTLADVMVVGVFQVATKFIIDNEMRKDLPKFEAYLKRVLEVPEMKAAFGPLELCETRVKG
ncbi:hypothetical protein VTJ83DRAFT_6177 [Remersonia thermophila]|uniref:Glutathione S-transferase n=1 Tax=Remersonia thermophila TaxID=72144 RepID=A0ABR4D934_9PEZI